MRVLHLTNDFRDNGTGITNVIRELAIAQRSIGLEVSIASEVTTSSYHRELEAHGVIFHRIDRIRTPLQARRVAFQVAAIEADVVHVHTGRAALAIAFAPSRVRRASVATVHNTFQRSSILMTVCAEVVCISAAARERFAAMVPSSRRRLHVIYNPVPDVGSSVPAIEVPPGTIVYVGGLHPRKGVDVLVAAVRQLVTDGDEGVRLWVYGNRDAAELEAAASDLVKSDHVRFRGFTYDPRSVMAAARVVAIPSRDEPFGLVAVEARSAGAAILASHVGGLAEALDGGAAGLLVPSGDVSAWARELRRLLDDDDHRDRWAAAARRGIEKFAPADVARMYLDVYDRLRRRG